MIARPRGWALLWTALWGCSPSPAREPSFARAGLSQLLSFAALRAEEAALRARADPLARPDARAQLGTDPRAAVPLAGGLLVLTGQPAGVVWIDPRGAPRSSWQRSGLSALTAKGDVAWASSSTDRQLRALAMKEGEIVRVADQDVQLPGEGSVHSVALAGACAVGVDRARAELAWACAEHRGTLRVPVQPHQVVATSSHVVVVSAVSHTLTIVPWSVSGPSGNVVELRHDGPFFGAAAHLLADGSTLLAAGGVEDHPLDRTGGSFGYIDSFLWAYRLRGAEVDVLSTHNLSELGVITPKAILIEPSADGARITTSGFGSGAGAMLSITDPASEGSVGITPFTSAPGVTALVRTSSGQLLACSSLLDAVVDLERGGERVTDLAPASNGDPGETPTLRLGELLFYTDLMGPFQKSDAALSRFTCETCHFEGGIDGRVHRTGRGDTTASTKPLFGLGNNGPHFTRALDGDLTEMVFAEFRVAAANSGGPAWFSLSAAPIPWLARAEVDPTAQAADLRRALLLYLASLPPPPRPLERAALTDPERRGLELFAERCEGCHAARLETNRADSRVPKQRWEALVLHPQAPLTWARSGYEKTGVEPYVHPEGARPSSLRRIADKVPLFTNGSAVTLEQVVVRARFGDGRFLHSGDGPGLAGFDTDEASDLVSFLRLL